MLYGFTRLIGVYTQTGYACVSALVIEPVMLLPYLIILITIILHREPQLYA